MSDALPTPTTHFAESDGVSIAYQAFGSGAQDLVVVPGIISHVEANWRYDAFAALLRHLAQSFRVLIFDKRGQGMSDRFEGTPTLEERMDDVRAVMQAAGSHRAVLFALSEGGAMAALFTATYPALVDRLVMFGTMARFTKSADFPIRPSLERMLAVVLDTWGTPRSAPLFCPGRGHEPAYAEMLASYQRQSSSPSAIKRLLIANDQIDVRAVLPQIRRPTLIIQRRDDRVVTCANGRYLADHVPDAMYLELPGADHFAAEGDSEAVVDAIVQFAHARPAPAALDHAQRWLATVLFTDIVGSTERAGQLGDRAWRELQERFHAMGRRQLQAHRGVEVDTAGDGLFATFDGPARAVRCALAMLAEARVFDLTLRAGLHTGEVETSGEKVSGMAVHIGARVMAQAGDGQVWVSSTVRDLVAGSGLTFETQGARGLKGVPGEWALHRALEGVAG